MRKRIYILMFACALALGGCSDESDEVMDVEKNDKQLVVEDVKDYYEVVENVDFSEPHIEVELRGGLNVDADISNGIPEKMGVYKAEKANVSYMDNYDEFMNSFVKCIDEYFGEDRTITQMEAYEKGDEKLITTFCVGYEVGNLSKYRCSSVWDNKYSYLKSDYNEKEIYDIVQGFVEHFKEFLPVDISAQYFCVHFNDEYWNMIEESSKRKRKDFENSDMDYYMIRVYPEVEIGTYIADEAYVDIILNENKELISFIPKLDMKVGECLKKEYVLNTYEMLEVYFEKYAKNPLYTGVTIREMRLGYRMVKEQGNNGAEGVLEYLEPVWYVEYTKNGMLNCKTQIFSAFTGELLESLE